MKNKIKKTLIGAIAAGMLYVSGTGIVVPRMIKERVNTPQTIEMYQNAITEQAKKGIEEKIGNRDVKEETLKRTYDAIERIVENGDLKTQIHTAPKFYAPQRLNPENYTFRIEYKGDSVATFGIQRGIDGNYGLREGTLQVNKNCKLINELTDTAKATALGEYLKEYAPYAGGIAITLLAGAGIKGKNQLLENCSKKGD